MSFSPLNPIPEDILLNAKQVYSANHAYIAFGNQSEFLLKGLDWDKLSPNQTQPKGFLALLAVISLFQYAEGLSDRQAALATGQRLDWKYALHLPLAYPGIAPLALCLFRKRLADYPSNYPVFQELIHKLIAIQFFQSCSQVSPRVLEVLEANCLRNCLDVSINALLPAIEVLAAENPAWLNQVALPHWVSRYVAPHRDLWQASSMEELHESLHSLFQDMHHLVAAIRGQPRLGLERYPEIRVFLHAWDMLKEPSAGYNHPEQSSQALSACAECMINPFLQPLSEQ
jgi:transposase